MNQQHFYRDGAQLPAHKLVLASQTSYFEGLFRQENPDQVAKKDKNWSYLGQIDKQKKVRKWILYITLNILGVTEF